MPRSHPRLQALTMAAHFAHTRWRLDFRDRAHLEAWQQRSLKRFLADIVPLAGRYRNLGTQRLEDLPYMDKALMMRDFAGGNTHGVELDQAMAVAVAAEQSRDFSPQLGELTVGLSSGTSGHRGIFLVSPAERLRWAGVLLARTLPASLLRRLLTPWQPPLRIAFYLRANSNLYTTLASRRIDFRFFDLLAGVPASLPQLAACQPDVLVAPATVLRALADEASAGRLSIRPQHVISVAEVLEAGDAAAVQAAFLHPTHQIYQATEGFLGYTCEAGTLHLNESHIHFEPEWLDEAHTRFQPVITDFSRHTQLIVRYRLNDVLRVSDTACPCGRAERSIAAIEGRADEVLWLPALQGNRLVAIYPDLLRQAMLLAGPSIAEYSIAQQGMHWQIGLLPAPGASPQDCAGGITAALTRLCQQHAVETPQLDFGAWQAPVIGAKRRRIRSETRPEISPCMS